MVATSWYIFFLMEQLKNFRIILASKYVLKMRSQYCTKKWKEIPVPVKLIRVTVLSDRYSCLNTYFWAHQESTLVVSSRTAEWTAWGWSPQPPSPASREESQSPRTLGHQNTRACRCCCYWCSPPSPSSWGLCCFCWICRWTLRCGHHRAAKIQTQK